ncbi:MAG TPA: DUF6629 family protein [Bacteroidales bacterium]|nr:DUF6629 family protein [Bacteroidales bacterium]
MSSNVLYNIPTINRKDNFMCFSPEASFAGGVIISAIGVVTLRKIHRPSQILFACIPIFFGFQQFAEGFVWLTLPMPDHTLFLKIFVYIFLITAQIIWPVLIPLSVLMMEKSNKKKEILKLLLIAGIGLSMYYGYCLLNYHINPRIEGFHIKYYNDFPISLSMIATIIYLIVTIPPLFISSLKRTHLLGILMTLSCIITVIFFKQYLTSVWCFFAALISGVIYWILHDLQKEFILSRFRLLRMHPVEKKV